MARSKSGEQARGKSKAAIAVEELTRGVEKFHELLAQVEDLSREGFPYRDAVRAKTELQIRDNIKRVFGDKSTEYQTYKTHRLRTNTPDETAQSIALLNGLIASLENRKLDLLGIKLAVPPTPEVSSPTQSEQARPQLSLVPPAGSPAQVTLTPLAGTTTAVTPSPITMSVALTTNLGIPPTQPMPPAHTAQPERVAQGGQDHSSAPNVLQQAPACSTSSPTASPSKPSAPLPPPPRTRPSTTMPKNSPDSTPSTLHSPQSRTEQPGATMVPPPTSPAGNAVLPAPATRSRSRASMRLSAPPGIELRPQAPAAAALRGTVKGDPPPFKPRNEAAIQRARLDVDPLERVLKLCSRFHAVVRQLRLRREYRATLEVEDEYDVQDLLHALLRLEFDEIEIEDWTPSYTQGANRTTFFLVKNTVAVVVKKTRPGLGGREVAEELKVDAERYATHKNCGTLFCFVYDPEARIGNPRSFETDLTSICDTYTVQVLVAPK